MVQSLADKLHQTCPARATAVTAALVAAVTTLKLPLLSFVFPSSFHRIIEMNGNLVGLSLMPSSLIIRVAQVSLFCDLDLVFQ